MKRWAERASTGLTDEELADALAYEIGIFGGSCGPGEIYLIYQRAGLKSGPAGNRSIMSLIRRFSRAVRPSRWRGRCMVSAIPRIRSIRCFSGLPFRARPALPGRALVNRTPVLAGFRPCGFDPSCMTPPIRIIHAGTSNFVRHTPRPVLPHPCEHQTHLGRSVWRNAKVPARVCASRPPTIRLIHN